MLPPPTEDLARWVTLAALCAIAAVADLGFRRIPNALTLPAMGIAAVAAAAYHGLPGVANAALTGLVCLLAMAVFHRLGALGGGDVKLMAAIGVAGGWPFIAHAAVFGGVVGGAMGLVALVWRRNVFEALARELQAAGRAPAGAGGERPRVPFGAALSVGALLALVREVGWLS